MGEDQEDQINLRECVKLREGPFNGVTVEAYNTQTRILLTSQNFSTGSFQNKVDVHEYQRNEKPQFTYIGRREVEEGDQEYEPLNDLDETDRREGFEDGLWRAINVIYDRLYNKQDGWKVQHALSDIADEIREIGRAMGFTSPKLYSEYKQFKETAASNYTQSLAEKQTHERAT